MMITLKDAVSGKPITINPDDISSVDSFSTPHSSANAFVWMRSGGKYRVRESYEEIARLVTDRSHNGPSSWVVLGDPGGLATTVHLPGIGSVVAFGDDKRTIAFAHWEEASVAADKACEEYGMVMEIARIDLMLGVCE